MRSAATRRWGYDTIAIGLSVLCLIHCLALPALVLLVPALAIWMTVPESVHAVLLAIALPTSTMAIMLGFRAHRMHLPAVLAIIGLVLLGFGVFGAPTERAETIATVIGGMTLALAHALNWRALPHREVS